MASHHFLCTCWNKLANGSARAGAEVTAMGVLGDLAKVIKRLEPPPGARGTHGS